MVRILNKMISKASKKTVVLRYRYLDPFVFIHINKTGGTSVSKALNIPLEHKTAMQFIDEMGQSAWDRKLSFVTVRNPWDKVVSHYHHRLQSDHTDLAQNPIPFKEWVQRAYRDHDPAYYNNPILYSPQLDWISDAQGNIVVKEILRFEKLSEDFRQVMEKLNRKIELPHARKSKRSDFRDYDDTETIDIVADCFEPDITRFGYVYE